jgi:TRAP-type C4-dicarboxylate transport system permease small subunit
VNTRSTSFVRRALDTLYLVAAVLAGASLIALAGLVVVQIVARMLHLVILFTDTLAGYALAAITFLALPYTFRTGGHVRMSLLIEGTSGRLNRFLEIFCLVMAAAIVGYFAYYSVGLTYDFYRFHDVSSGSVTIPLWIPQLAMTVGLLLMSIAILDDLVAMLLGGRASYQDHKESIEL